jgi:hypothetical protein
VLALFFLPTSSALAALPCPSPFALHSAALNGDSLCSSLSSFTPPPLLQHSTALHPSLPHASLSPFRHPSLSLFTAQPFQLHSVAVHCSLILRRPSPFITPLFAPHTSILHSRPSLPRPSPCIARPITLPSLTLHSCPSLRRPSLSPFTLPLFTFHPATLHFSPCHSSLFPLPLFTHHSRPAFRCTDKLPSSNRAKTTTQDLPLVELKWPSPSLKLPIIQLSVERQPPTISSWNSAPTDLLPNSLRTFDTLLGQLGTEQPLPKSHVVQRRHPQV